MLFVLLFYFLIVFCNTFIEPLKLLFLFSGSALLCS